MVVSEIALYNTLKSKLGDKEAQAVVEGIKQEVKNEFENKKDILATKDDISLLKSDIANMKIDVERGFKDQLKWIFIFWMGQLASFIAIAKFSLHQ